MIQVALHFTLTGTTTEWKRYMKDAKMSWYNADTFEYVKGLVTAQFGDRPMLWVNEANLVNDANPYPHYFTAGWFVSTGDECKELVIITHAESMEKANKLLMHHIKSVDWDSTARDV
jgi:hypothetical protein